MMKTMLLGALMMSAAVTGFAQESRQDASASAYGLIIPDVNGVGGIHQSATSTMGFLGSYRYMVTPRSALEANYSFSQYATKYTISSLPNVRIHTRQQEFSLAYVYSRNYKNFNPFAEAGVGALAFSPIRDYETLQFDGKRNTRIGALFGLGVAYELSPSFDIRAEYRGLLVKSPDFGFADFKANRYEFVSMPAIGVAYHF